MAFREDRNLMNALDCFRVKCKCGHSIIFTSNREKFICNHCGRYVYKNKKIEFKDKILRERRNNNEKYNSQED